MLLSSVSGGVFPLSVSRMFGSKWSLIYVTTESLSVASMCTDVSLIMLVTMVASVVSGDETISLIETASFTLTGFFLVPSPALVWLSSWFRSWPSCTRFEPSAERLLRAGCASSLSHHGGCETT